MRKEFAIFKKGMTAEPVIILSKDGEEFDREKKMNFYRSLGYTITAQF